VDTQASTRPSASFRLDIQVLRAVAVGAVVLYHLWPTRFPSGYVGVDIFFVISGFLITSHLMRSEEKGGIALGRFWANRARRLLPLACVVLLATIAAVFLFMPESTWKVSLRNIVASAVYAQNWLLAGDSVNYLARDQAPVPTQHFWSLSAEEQFYIVWPLLIMLGGYIAVKIAARRGSQTRATAVRWGSFAAICAVFIASFVFSLWMTNAQPSVAYFVTTTRAWEFAAGGLVAFIAYRHAQLANRHSMLALRVVVSWVGFAIIVGTIFLLPDGTPFPGVAALLPVVGTALFIWAGDVHRWFAPTVLGRIRPITYLGDISYGIYLWHWPIIVVVPYALGTPLTTPMKIGIVCVTVVLAAISKVAVEDPFRYRKFWTKNVRRGFYPAAVGILSVCAVAVGSIVGIQASAPALPSADAASSLSLDAATDPTAPLVPSIANKADDRGPMFDCFDFDDSGPHECTYGPENATVSIAVTGDSHAAHLIPALIDIVTKRGWKLTTFVGLNCDAALAGHCGGGVQGLADIAKNHYDLVLYTAFRGSSSSYEGVADYLTKLRDTGTKILPIADVPYNPTSALDCMDASGGNAGRAVDCTIPLKAALGDVPDRVAPIAKSLGLSYADFTDAFCDDSVCESVIDNVVVYQDSPSSHLTATFVRMLEPRIEGALASALDPAVKTP
jgi:peptidoglycan/LPS O-acetylase OafA/YrhL